MHTGFASSPEAQAGSSIGPTERMRAVAQERYGSADTLQVTDLDRPEIASDEGSIEVAAGGVDRGFWHLATGKPFLVRLAGYGITKPKNPVPGLDVSGRVVAVGTEVRRLTLFLSAEHHSHMERLAELLESGEVAPSVGRRYRLDEVPAAIADLEAGQARGKSLIVVGNGSDRVD